jgi:excisionase family DNA binding protein
MTAKERTMSPTADSPLTSTILTIDEAAAYLAIPKATLYTWRTRRAGFGPPAVKMGGCLRYRRSDLDAWVARHLETFEAANNEADSAHAITARQRGGESLSRPSRPRNHAR